MNIDELLRQIQDLESIKREEKCKVVEEKTKHEKTLLDLESVRSELKMQTYKNETLKVRLSQLESIELPTLKRHWESFKETLNLTKKEMNHVKKNAEENILIYEAQM